MSQGCEATKCFGGQGLWMGIIFGILVQVLMFVAITLRTNRQNKPFEHKPFDGRTIMGFGVLNGISIGLLNQSLGFNSVGFYQGKSSALVGSSFLILQRTRQKIDRVLSWLGRLDKRHRWITTLDVFQKISEMCRWATWTADLATPSDLNPPLTLSQF